MQTPLYDRHKALNAKMVSFAGWDMPLQYSSIINEHHIVRTQAGVFDVSHMGLLEITGEEAENLLDYLSTQQIIGHPDFTVIYTVWSLPNGGSVDDLLVYKINKKHFFVVVNAANRKPDLEHLLSLSKKYQVQIREHYETHGILAIQGPLALQIIESLLHIKVTMPPMHVQFLEAFGGKIMLSTTGYTGAGGCEIIAEKEIIVSIWDALMKQGVAPIGLGARDTLRLEKGYALYGHELSYGIAPIESVAAWTVKFEKHAFLGKNALQSLFYSKFKRHAYGVTLEEKAIPRQGFSVFWNKEKIGKVTSGGYSPSLNQSIALILVSKSVPYGEDVEIEIRQEYRHAKIVKLPFVK